MVSLIVLREQNEHTRFARQRVDDSRTAIPTPAAEALAAELRAAGETVHRIGQIVERGADMPGALVEGTAAAWHG